MLRAIVILFASVLIGAAPGYTVSGTAPKNAIAVWIAGAPPASASTFEMHNVDRTFKPEAIVVPLHSQVRFPNDDPFYHSIYSADKQNGFDIGYYDTGPGKVVQFDHEGVVQVRCHIHGYMHGIIVVAGGPSSQINGGAFSIAGIPAGKYVVHEVLGDGSEKTSPLVVSGDTSLKL